MIYFVIGNGGSGKSYFSRRVSEITGYPVLHLDHVSFSEKHYRGFKSDEERKELVNKWILENPNGIIEGVYDDVAYWIEEHIGELVYLDIPWEEAEKGLRGRKFDPEMTDAKHHNRSLENFIDYCKEYYLREPGDISKTDHDILYEKFSGNKIRFYSRQEVNSFIEKLKSSKN